MSLLMKLPNDITISSFNGVQLPLGKHEVTPFEYGVNCYAKDTTNPLLRGKFLGYVSDSKNNKPLPGTAHVTFVCKCKAKNQSTINLPIQQEQMNNLKGELPIEVILLEGVNKTTGKPYKIKVPELSV